MRIAFASCMNTEVFADQPVWDWIAAQQPDHLVLLGDSIYLDAPVNPVHPERMTDRQFTDRLFSLYTAQLAQPAFRRLVQALPPGRVTSIWDDHDFLWDDACGAEAALSPRHVAKIQLSTAYQTAFRAALASALAPSSFPGQTSDPALAPAAQPLDTPSLELAPGVWLHLSDNRTARTRTWLLDRDKRTAFGAAQRARIEAAVLAQPDAVHLFASGSTLDAYRDKYEIDWRWLTDLAPRARLLVLSGDIHRNDSREFNTTGWPLYEATSSGAAVRKAVTLGKSRRNFGLLDIDASHVNISLFADNAAETGLSRRIVRSTWRTG